MGTHRLSSVHKTLRILFPAITLALLPGIASAQYAPDSLKATALRVLQLLHSADAPGLDSMIRTGYQRKLLRGHRAAIESVQQIAKRHGLPDGKRFMIDQGEDGSSIGILRLLDTPDPVLNLKSAMLYVRFYPDHLGVPAGKIVTYIITCAPLRKAPDPRDRNFQRLPPGL